MINLLFLYLLDHASKAGKAGRSCIDYAKSRIDHASKAGKSCIDHISS